MVKFLFISYFWNGFLILSASFLLYFLVTYPFQRRWLTARIRIDEWLEGKYFRSSAIKPPGFEPVGLATGLLAGSLEKLVRNYRNTRDVKTMNGLRKEAREMVISMVESVSEVLDHWKALAGMDLVSEELKKRAALDAGNLEKLHENLEAFRAGFQKAAVSQNSDSLAEASEKVVEISHFARLMSESIDSEVSPTSVTVEQTRASESE